MTTIAYRDGIMASDSGVWFGDAAAPFARKLIRGFDGTLYGFSGWAAHAQRYMDWVEKGCEGEEPKSEALEKGDSSLLVLKVPVRGPIALLTARGPELYPGAPYFAIGSGNVGALCAMHAGATAEGAIWAAIMHASGADSPVRTICHEK